MVENPNTKILEKLIDQDFGLDGREDSRWAKSEDHDSLVLDRERGLFFWNSKEVVGDPLVYLTKVRGMNFKDARDYLNDFKDFSNTFVYTISPGTDDVVVFPHLIEVFYELGEDKDKRDYWYRRGILDSTIDRFQLGWYNGYNVIPIFVDGTFRNFQMRRDRPDKRIKGYYKNVGPLPFNTDVLKLTDTVYICEGLTDCLRLNQEGVPTVSHNTGAGGWKEDWFKYFIRQKNIYIVFDNDEAGKKGAKRVAKNLGIYRTKIFTFSGNEDAYDVVNFFADGGTKEQFLIQVEEGSKYLFEL